jgi:DNA invertase Pin-like site-specific DNA recombinase
MDAPVLIQAHEMARRREYEVLVVLEMDRLARSFSKQMRIEEDLEKAGVRVEYSLYRFPDTSEGRLDKILQAGIAEYEREKTAQRTVRRLRRCGRRSR